MAGLLVGQCQCQCECQCHDTRGVGWTTDEWGRSWSWMREEEEEEEDAYMELGRRREDEEGARVREGSMDGWE